VLLAARPDEAIDDYLGQRPMVALTPLTLVERREIKDDLEAVREAGVGHDLEEVALGCCCVAAPVWDPRGAVVGSMGISVPAERWHREGARLTRICRSAAAQASGFGPARAGGRARDGRSRARREFATRRP
jgi:DNA-binding IclR family transcriptional regulator